MANKKNGFNILIVDDDRYVREVLAEALNMPEYNIRTATSGEHAMKLFEKYSFDVVLSDLKMKRVDGVELLRYIKTNIPETDVIIITAYGTLESAVQALKLGAYDYLTKPVDVVKLRKVMRNVTQQRRLQQENIVLKQQLEESVLPESILGNSDPIVKTRQIIKQIAMSHVTVLIEGESGTGKELVARSIHNLSNRKDKPFITVNCGALPATLFESELFGHEKGAFTGAMFRRKGRFELAHEGTLFLDEIAEISLESQVNFLRVIEDSKIRRIGSDKEFSVDVRIIAATNKDLKKMVAQGTFREDLFYRLNVINIKVPPLRQRKGDIPILAKAFLEEFAERHNLSKKKIPPAVLKKMMAYYWPGNIRELRNFMERALLLSPTDEISTDSFTFEEVTEKKELDDQINIPFGTTIREAERALILSTLKRVKGHRKRAAEILGISVRSLQYRLKEYHRSGYQFS